jgi:hypothetical protein
MMPFTIAYQNSRSIRYINKTTYTDRHRKRPALKTRAPLAFFKFTFMTLNYNKISLFLVNEVLLNRILSYPARRQYGYSSNIGVII